MLISHRPTQTETNDVFGRQMASGEMSELAEGARLEIVCTTKSGTEGSNPSLSAILLMILRCRDVL